VEEPAPPVPEATTPKRGFGAAKPAEEAPVLKAVPKAKVAPTPAPAADSDAMSLADEIAALVGGMDSDD
jgi:hypothetical protein